MRKSARHAAIAVSLATLFGGAALAPATAVGAEDLVAKGKQVAFDRKKGNCLACHMIDDGQAAGNIGPPLVAMKARFPDRAALVEQIYDPQIKNPDTRMPPFGKHKIISDADIDAIVEYLYTL